MSKLVYNILLLALVHIVFFSASAEVENKDPKKGVKIGVSKYSPFGGGGNRIFDQAVLIPNRWKHLRPFFTEVKNDKGRFARTKNSTEEIVYKVDKNIQGYCVYTTFKPEVARDVPNEIGVYFSKNGSDWLPVDSAIAGSFNEVKKGTYEVTQPNNPEWVNIQYFGYYDLQAKYLKIKWNNANGDFKSPQINRVEINYSNSPSDGWKNMFVDECEDFTKTLSHSENVVTDSANPSLHRSVIVYAGEKVIQQEIEYAKEAGIDFWIWLMGEKNSAHTWSIEQYLTLPNYQNIGFCVEFHHPTAFNKSGKQSHIETWEEYCQRLTRYMSEPNYIRVLDGRPLVYTVGYINESDVKKFRKIVITAGLKDPYLVDAYWGKPRIIGADAISAYNGSNGFNRNIWDYYSNHDHLKVMPNFGTGMNDVCRIDNPPPWGNWNVDKPFLTIEELKQGLKESLDYVAENHEDCNAQVLTVFDWDSQTEAGWICPVINEDGSIIKDRLNAFKEVIVYGSPVEYKMNKIVKGSNLVFNPGFEENTIPRSSPIGWKTKIDNRDDVNMENAFKSQRGGYKSDLCGAFSYLNNYGVTTYQDISAIEEGVYTMSAYVKSSGNQKVAQMYIDTNSGERLAYKIEGADAWTKISIGNIRITGGNCVLGFYSVAHGKEWLLFDDIKLEQAENK